MTPCEHLETQQALFKQFAEILDFVLAFDDLKVRKLRASCTLASQPVLCNNSASYCYLYLSILVGVQVIHCRVHVHVHVYRTYFFVEYLPPP